MAIGGIVENDPRVITEHEEEAIVEAFECLQEAVHAQSTRSGWWPDDGNDGEKLCLMHSELSEALDWIRKGNPKSDHIPEFTGLEEELADTVIRIMDYTRQRGLRLAEAIVAKHRYNGTRAYRHGGRAF